tara:strand:- start:2024 stop:2275 length:252 start_codon:yes stop_codon:yes gene_type:complete
MFYFRQKRLIEHIKFLNKDYNLSLSEDPKHWESLNVFDIGDFQLYLEREHEINMMKSERRDTGNEGSIGEEPNYPYSLGDLHI